MTKQLAALDAQQLLTSDPQAALSLLSMIGQANWVRGMTGAQVLAVP